MLLVGSAGWSEVGGMSGDRLGSLMGDSCGEGALVPGCDGGWRVSMVAAERKVPPKTQLYVPLSISDHTSLCWQ